MVSREAHSGADGRLAAAPTTRWRTSRTSACALLEPPGHIDLLPPVISLLLPTEGCDRGRLRMAGRAAANAKDVRYRCHLLVLQDRLSRLARERVISTMRTVSHQACVPRLTSMTPHDGRM